MGHHKGRSWFRVAQGLHKVTRAAVVAGVTQSYPEGVRIAQHGTELVAAVAKAIRFATGQHHNHHNHPNGSSAATAVPTTTPRSLPTSTSFASPSAPPPPHFNTGSSVNPLDSAPTRPVRTYHPTPPPVVVQQQTPEPPSSPLVVAPSKQLQPGGATKLHKGPNSSSSSSSSSGSGNQSTMSTTTATTTRIRRMNDDDDYYNDDASDEKTETNSRRMIKEGTAVPSSRIQRALGFANLGLGLAAGTLAEGALRLFGKQQQQQQSATTATTATTTTTSQNDSSILLSDANADRLAASLCRMRGAALKMGQMLSIQDESLLPPTLSRALRQVRQGADAMPTYQLEQQLLSQLGPDWQQRHNVISFDPHPFAAASIGQVHRATIRSTNDEISSVRHVVIKVQYPGVAQSIESDLRNLGMLVTWSGLAPKGLFIENVIKVGQAELKIECDYRREMQNQKRIKKLVEADPILCENNFTVPDVVDELTTDQIITSEYLPGGTIDKIANVADQEERNRIGRTILYLTMKELFDWRFMQTDPNWGNFLYDVGTQTTGLIDFGATREYSKEFVDGYLRIVWASANRDETTLMEQSHKMGFLTGNENAQMLRAHKLSGFTVGEPFWTDDVAFDFRGSNISERLGEHTAVFLQHRLTPPPEEVYTLHRKLAGAYMLCIKLGAVVRSRDMLESIVANHVFDDGMVNPVTGRR